MQQQQHNNKATPAFIQKMNENAAKELEARIASNPHPGAVLLIQRASRRMKCGDVESACQDLNQALIEQTQQQQQRRHVQLRVQKRILRVDVDPVGQ